MNCELCKINEGMCNIRTRLVCKNCLKILKMDNRYRNSKGIDITSSLRLLPQTFKRIAYNPLNDLFKNKTIEEARKEYVE